MCQELVKGQKTKKHCKWFMLKVDSRGVPLSHILFKLLLTHDKNTHYGVVKGSELYLIMLGMERAQLASLLHTPSLISLRKCMSNVGKGLSVFVGSV